MTTTATRRLLTDIRRDLERLKAARAASPILRRFREDPSRLMTDAGITPDSWQRTLLRSTSDRVLMLITRQGGKSLTAAALALREALLKPPALVLLLSPGLRQSGELFRAKVRRLFRRLGRPVGTVQETQLTMELSNGSRIVALPGEEETIRGYSDVSLLIIDEAARVPDELYFSVRPMLAVSKGKLVCLSTPWGKRGWFYDEWISSHAWHRVKVSADQCPRISPEFLAEERASLGDYWYSQEYELCFRDVIDAYFRAEDIEAALVNDVEPIVIGGSHNVPR